MRYRIHNILPLLPVMLLLSACQSKAPAPKAHDHAAHHAAAPTPAPKQEDSGPSGPRLETGSFLLEVTSAEPVLTVGKPVEVAIALEGRGDWHVNQEYPIRIDLKAAPGAGLQRDELIKGDAKEFNDDKAVFVTALEPSEAGEHEVTCDVSFAMCTDENCVLENRTLAMQVKVE